MKLGILNYSIYLIIIFALFSSAVVAVDTVKFEKEFGGKGSGTGTFGRTLNVAFDYNNNIFISDKENKMVQKLDPEGNFIMQIPKLGEDSYLFNAPGDIAVDIQGNIYVADWASKYIEGTENPRLYAYGPCVRKFNSAGIMERIYFIDEFSAKPKTVVSGTFIVDENGNYGWALQPKGYDREVLVSVDSNGNVYILDIKNNVIHKFTPSGEKLISFGKYGSGNGEIDNASDMIIDNENNIFVTDKGNNRVVRFDINGNFVLSFGSKGQNNGQFIEPVFVIVTNKGDILVKDSSKFERIGLEHPFRGKQEIQPGEEYLLQPSKDSELTELEYRIRRLEELLKEDEKKEEAKEKLLAKHARFYTVIERIQKFNKTGNYIDRIIYKIDKNDRELHDLFFLAIDPLGRLYLQDKDRLVIRRYSIEGFVPKFSEVEKIYTARTENRGENFIEDYSDIDKKTDLEDTRMERALKQALLMNYDATEKLNLSIYNTHILARRDSTNETPPKPEDNFDYIDSGWDNNAGLNLKFIVNPDPYKYREMNFYSQFIAGSNKYRSEAIFTNVNKQKSSRVGDSTGILVGTDLDIHHNANVSIEYLRLRPDINARNISTKLYDVSGDLYQTSKSYNSSNIIIGELNIKF